MAEAEKATTPTTGKTVVIGMDGSDNSLFALQWFAEHVYMPEDKVVMVYCVELSEVLSSSQWYHGLYVRSTAKVIYGREKLRKKEKPAPNPAEVDAFQTILNHEIQKVQTRLEEFAQYMKDLRVNGVVKSTHASKPGEGIINVAKEVGATLIVTGTRGLGKIRRTLLGSVSDYLVHHSHVPVLVCRHKDKKEKHH